LVIARNSTFAYKGQSPDIQEVARKLGAQYVVEGSVQKTKERVRITAQLIDANTGHHVWSDRYDRKLKDIFALQDEITMKIMNAIGMKLVEGERFGDRALPPSGRLEVYMKFLKGVEYFYRMNKEDNVLCRQANEEAIALDPEYGAAYSALAWTHLMDLYFQASETPEISFVQASKNIKKALALDNAHYGAHVVLGQLHLLRKEHDKAIAALERAISINPNGANAYVLLGHLFTVTGRVEEGIKLIKKAFRLNPLPPSNYVDYLGTAYYLSGRYGDAIELHNKVLKRSPNNLITHISLTAAYSASGREGEARHHAERVLELDPAFTLDRLVEMTYFKDEAEADLYVANLRKAGLK